MHSICHRNVYVKQRPTTGIRNKWCTSAAPRMVYYCKAASLPAFWLHFHCNLVPCWVCIFLSVLCLFFVVFCFSFWSLVVVQLQPTYIYPSPKQRIMKINTSHWKVVYVFFLTETRHQASILIVEVAYFIYVGYIGALDLGSWVLVDRG